MSGDRAVDLSDQVAVVTGGGRGIGRAHALALASRGAQVVVNDLGATNVDGTGPDASVAEEVAAEIRALGGDAVASSDDVSTVDGGDAIIATALERFGRLDVLIHNAGFIRSGPFGALSRADFDAVMGVNVGGALNVGQPAWRHMLEAGYGRILFTTSYAITGLAFKVPYATAKAALIGLTRTLAAEAAAEAMARPSLDLVVNAVSPLAETRLGGPSMQSVFGTQVLDPAMVAAAAVYLSSPACRLNGAVVQAGASHIGQIFYAMTDGWAKGTADLSPEDVRDHLPREPDLSQSFVLVSPSAATGRIAGRVLGDDDEAAARIEHWMAAFAPGANVVPESPR
jgi:NAD(P)-dependent dehydrogenase (short-subunit alcohol dehydrogenase family)